MQRYHRQVLIEKIGLKGQSKLLQSRVAVIGCGGLGSAVIPMLAAAGIGELLLFDNDNVAISNLNRQIMFKEKNLGINKAFLAKEFVRDLNSDIKVKEYTQKIMPHNYFTLLQDIDLVIDCTDGLTTKFFLNDCCLDLGIPLIHCAATAFEIQLLLVKNKGNPCLRCYFEVLPKDVKTCNQIGILGATCNVAGGIAVSEAIKYLLGIENLNGLLKFNLEQNNYNLFSVPNNKDCIACGENAIIDPTNQNQYVIREC